MEEFLKQIEFLIEQLKNQYPTDVINEIIDGYSTKKLTCFRVNTRLATKQEIIDTLDSNNIKYHCPNFYENAFVIDESDISIADLPIFSQGKIYLQNLSSMLPAIIANPQDNTDILDMAAAPGGKTTLMSNLAPKSRITACEVNKIRADKLRYNIAMQNAVNCFVIQKDSSQFEDFYRFDNILLDAPCSGTGTICSDNPKTYRYITPKLINNSSALQKKLLTKAINITKKGGFITYSTCSILKQENEDIILPFINQKKVMVVPLSYDELPLLPTTINGALCIKPTKEYEGFFVCRLIKL